MACVNPKVSCIFTRNFSYTTTLATIMKKAFLLLILIFSNHIIFSQIEKDIYELDSIHNLLTVEVKKIIDKNVREKKTVFLGEAVHHSGTDFLAKTEFIKYLVIEHQYKDIAFESDFFALLFDHNKSNLYPMWSNRIYIQCGASQINVRSFLISLKRIT